MDRSKQRGDYRFIQVNHDLAAMQQSGRHREENCKVAQKGCKRRLNTVALGRAKNVALEVEN